MSNLITLQEAATILGCSRPMLYYWERVGKLAIVTGPYGRRLVARADIMALRAERQAASRA